MTDNPVLRSIGVRLIDEVLDPALRHMIGAAMTDSPAISSTVYGSQEPGQRIDDEVRLSLEVGVPDAARAAVERRLSLVEPQLEQWYGGPLRRMGDLVFLRYGIGGHFLAHRDRPVRPDVDPRPEHVADRRLSVVLFVNDQIELGQASSGGYTGGALLFRGFEDEELRSVGFGVPQLAGSMVVFPSWLVHEVGRVLSGERRTIVCWYS